MMILIVMMLSLLFSSYIVDKYKIYWQSLRWGAVAALVCTYPLFKLMTLGHGATIIALIALLLVYSFTVSGPAMYVLNLIFPASMRYTGVALSHSIGTGVFIGVSPMIYTWLAHNFGAMAVSAWFYVVVVLMLIALYKVGSKNLTS